MYYHVYTYIMEKKRDEKEGRVTVEISGPILRVAMALRAKSEKDMGKPISLAGVVRGALIAQHLREIGEVEADIEQ